MGTLTAPLQTILAAVALAAAVVFVLALIGIGTGSVPWLRVRGRSAATALAAVAAAVLVGSVWLGWGGPLSGPGLRSRPLTDVPRTDLGTTNRLVERANQALGPSNRGVSPRVVAAPRPDQPRSPALWVAANDAPTREEMRRGILADAARIADAVFADEPTGPISAIRLVFTHPSGRTPAGAQREGVEPAVAIVDVRRSALPGLGRAPLTAEDLLRHADVQWLPPLDP